MGLGGFLTISGPRKEDSLLKPLLSIIVPCYNAQPYLARCLAPLLAVEQGLEVILVDDGSTDQTGAMIDQSAATHPTLIRALHQANGGHGAAIMAGIKVAGGDYLKVVDADDWLDQAALLRVLAFLQELREQDEQIDMLVSNYTYDKVNAPRKKTVRYPHLPTHQVFSWEAVHLPLGEYLLMHAVIYRTAMLVNEAHLDLPRHTFYVDNLYVFQPLPFVKRLYYLDVDLYHYFIGRADQSVNEAVMLKRIDQQLLVNRLMIRYYTQVTSLDSGLGKYMAHYLEIITAISSVLLLKDGRPAALAKKQALWHDLAQFDPALHNLLRHHWLGLGVNLPGKIGRRVAVQGYQLVQKWYGFN